ncbi:MAG: membrane protein [Acidimicrobiia bacterium]|nr:MAG: membrane protein [Acidimicrobiia bacterium]
MLPVPPRPELWSRLARLFLGLVLFGLGLALMVIADLGLAPWDVFHQGISERTGIPIGTVVIIIGLLLLLLWFPLQERIGIGTIANAIVIGLVLDLSLLVLPDRLDLLMVRWAAMLVGVVVVAIGSGYYIGSGLGPGPRDGLMTGIARITGSPIGLVRGVLEISVLVVGWLLGGTVGIGTVVFALAIGPLVQFFLSRLQVPPVVLKPDSSERRADG